MAQASDAIEDEALPPGGGQVSTLAAQRSEHRDLIYELSLFRVGQRLRLFTPMRKSARAENRYSSEAAVKSDFANNLPKFSPNDWAALEKISLRRGTIVLHLSY